VKILKNTEISNLMKICHVGAELFLVDRWMTDVIKQVVTFCNFANTLKIISKLIPNLLPNVGIVVSNALCHYVQIDKIRRACPPKSDCPVKQWWD
jgi:hypothetical protein